MIRTILLLFLIPLSQGVSSQPNTEIYLFDFKIKKGIINITNPRNISNNPGYDNQPSLLPDGRGILFSKTRDGQTDVALYEISSGTTKFVTETLGSEYSPTPIPGTSSFSTIVLEKDGTQLLYRYPINPGPRTLVGPELKIGYHCWYDKNTIYSFVLGDPFTFQESKLKEKENQIVGNHPGRSIHKIPGKGKVSFINKSDSTSWIISTYEPNTGDIDVLFPTLTGAEDMAWLDSEIAIMGSGSILYQRSMEDEGWSEVADLEEYGLSGISRIAVHRKKGLMVIVVDE